MLRRKMISFIVLAALLLAAMVPLLSAQDENVDIYGRPLPEDAAPYEMQVWQDLCNANRQEISFSSAVSVYSRICDQSAFDKFGDSLVNLDQDLNLIPGAAESWA